MRLEFWNQVEDKKRELIQEYATNRKAKIAAGEPDPYPLQPRDYSALFLMTLKNQSAGTVGGQVTLLNFALAARRIVGENLTPVMRVASTEEIQEFLRQSEERMAAARKHENALNHRRTVTVRAAEPKRRSAE